MPARGETKSVGGKSYEWNGRRWVPESVETTRQPISTKRSRYSQGAPRPARDPKPAEEQVAKERTGRDTRRGSGVRGRGPEQPLSFSPTIRGRSGAQRAKTAATPQAPESTSPTGRDETRTSQTGVVQTGTQTSPRQMTMEDANKILNRGGLEGKGYEVQNPFTSIQLPTSSASLYQGDGSDISYNKKLPENMFIQESDLKLSRNAFDAGSGVEYGQNLVQMPASGKIEYEQKAGAPLTVSSGTLKVTEANESAQQPEVNVDMARRRAFLDGDLNSMEALRAIEAQKGIVVTGNTYNIVNPNAGKEGENDFIKIDKAQRDTIMRGGEGAQNLLNSYVTDIKAEGQSLTSPAPDNYISTDQSPIAPIDSTAQVDASQITDAPTLIDEVNPAFTDKDRTGRYNIFRRS
tara:strand:- start:41 stop:1258 length:1218 start_codon:yes stop_codon:yes gene_type:complete